MVFPAWSGRGDSPAAQNMPRGIMENPLLDGSQNGLHERPRRLRPQKKQANLNLIFVGTSKNKMLFI
jgi:hypothetical protein